MSVAGALTDLRPSNMEDDLRTESLTLQVPILAGNTFYLWTPTTFAARILTFTAFVDVGDARINLDINGTKVTFTGGTDVDGNGDALIQPGAFVTYDASEDTDNLCNAGQYIKFNVVSVTSTPTIVAGCNLRRERTP